MKIIRARIRNGKLTDPVNRHDLDSEIADGRDGRLALVVILDESDAIAELHGEPLADRIEQAIRDARQQAAIHDLTVRT